MNVHKLSKLSNNLLIQIFFWFYKHITSVCVVFLVWQVQWNHLSVMFKIENIKQFICFRRNYIITIISTLINLSATKDEFYQNLLAYLAFQSSSTSQWQTITTMQVDRTIHIYNVYLIYFSIAERKNSSKNYSNKYMWRSWNK